MIRTGIDVLDASKTIVPCNLSNLTYTIEKLRQIGYRILVSEIINHNYIYLVADKQFKMIDSKK